MSKKGTRSSATTKKPQTTKSAPTREEIALRAYQLYLERGQAPGYELEDWTRAERELMPQNGRPQRKKEPKPIAV